jgi:hypothetical protein
MAEWGDRAGRRPLRRGDFDDPQTGAVGAGWSAWPPEPLGRALMQDVAGGGGLVIFHAANNAFP